MMTALTLPVLPRLYPARPVQERWIQVRIPAAGPAEAETQTMLDAEQLAGVENWVAYRAEGRSARALWEICESVERQLVIAGLGRHRIRPSSLALRTTWGMT